MEPLAQIGQALHRSGLPLLQRGQLLFLHLLEVGNFPLVLLCCLLLLDELCLGLSQRRQFTGQSGVFVPQDGDLAQDCFVLLVQGLQRFLEGMGFSLQEQQPLASG